MQDPELCLAMPALGSAHPALGPQLHKSCSAVPDGRGLGKGLAAGLVPLFTSLRLRLLWLALRNDGTVTTRAARRQLPFCLCIIWANWCYCTLQLSR